jgi:hypothetical protein
MAVSGPEGAFPRQNDTMGSSCLSSPRFFAKLPANDAEPQSIPLTSYAITFSATT